MAQAGGKNDEQLPAALAAAKATFLTDMGG
jgi:hypothetical protein